MREIIFRGKRIDNGEWVYGYYARKGADKESFRHYICVSTFSSDYRSNYTYPFYLNDYEVDPSTVGQYTGLTDKNGKKIFENDIVLCAEPLGMAYREIRGKVVYKLTGFVVDCGGFNTTLSGGLCQTPYYVIGNIHDDFELFDNPELLEDKL